MIGIGKSLFKSNVKVGGGASYDADAQAYFNVNTAITSTADKNEINDFYLGLKTDGIYTKLITMYFPIWLNASNSKWNLINNRTFDLSFSTGWTYANTGITPNGTSAFADTFLNPNTYLSITDQSHGVYSRTIGQNSGVSLGASFVTTSLTRIVPRNISNSCVTNINATTSDTTANTDGTGFYQISRDNSSSYIYARNLVQTPKARSINSNNIPYNIYIGANNATGSAGSYSNKELALTYSATALSSLELTNFYNRVDTLMTYFGINV